jgi:hypothetical protein
MSTLITSFAMIPVILTSKHNSATERCYASAALHRAQAGSEA